MDSATPLGPTPEQTEQVGSEVKETPDRRMTGDTRAELIQGALAGAVVTESIFSWRGMGLLFIDSLEPLDSSVIMAFVLLIAMAVVVTQIIVDLVYTWLDPRAYL